MLHNAIPEKSWFRWHSKANIFTWRYTVCFTELIYCTVCMNMTQGRIKQISCSHCNSKWLTNNPQISNYKQTILSLTMFCQCFCYRIEPSIMIHISLLSANLLYWIVWCRDIRYCTLHDFHNFMQLQSEWVMILKSYSCAHFKPYIREKVEKLKLSKTIQEHAF